MKRVKKLFITDGTKINTIWVDFFNSDLVVDFKYVKVAYDIMSKKYTFMAANDKFIPNPY